MKKLIFVILFGSILTAQPHLNINSKYFSNMSKNQYYSNLQHYRLLESFSTQKYSEGGRPTEDVFQYWSIDNNRWENSVRYTYEYAAGKTNADYFPNLMTMREWFWCNINLIWNLNADANYSWNTNGTIQSWLQSDAYGGPQARHTFTYDVFGDGTSVVRSNETWNGSNWQENWRQETINNQAGFPTQTEHFDCTPGNCEPLWFFGYSYTATPGNPDVITYSQYVNNAYDAVGQWRFEYGLPGYVPLSYDRENGWNNNASIVSYFLSTDNGANWSLNSTEEVNVNSENIPETYRFLDEHGAAWLIVDVYSSSTGSGKIKTGLILDNSDVRIVRSESKYFDGSNWVNASRNWYSYEGLQMATGDEISIPDEFSLDQNYPNPFNPSTTITFDLSEDANVKIAIYDMTGRLIRELVNQTMTIGSKTISWDGKDDRGNPVSGGIYFYKLQAVDFTQTRKMVLMK